MFGVLNVLKNQESYAIGGGNQDNGTSRGQFLCGVDNQIMTSSNKGGITLFGNQLKVRSTGPTKTTILGSGATTATYILDNTKNDLKTGIAGGNNSNLNIECYPSFTKLQLPLQLQTDATEVNAITPAQNSPASADDMTLVTKSYISSEVGHTKTYWPASEQSLSANTTYSIGSLIGDNSWTFPFSSGSIVFALYVNGVEYRASLILPPYLDSNVTPQLKVPITACYNTDNGDSGRIDGVLLVYNTSTKEISFEGPEGIEFDNPSDVLTSAYNWGNIDIWFVGLTCFDHI